MSLVQKYDTKVPVDVQSCLLKRTYWSTVFQELASIMVTLTHLYLSSG